MVYHGFPLVSMVFQGGFMVVVVFDWLPGLFRVVLWFLVCFHGFSRKYSGFSCYFGWFHCF